MNDIIAQAQYRIRKLSEVNSIDLNREMLKVPVETVKEYAKKMGYTLEEVREDLDGSEAMFTWVNPFTREPIIVYDDDVLKSYDDEEAIQIIIHEYLHYGEASEDEAEDEVLSMIIAFAYDKPFEEGRKIVRCKIEREKHWGTYKDPEMVIGVKKKLNTMTLKDARRWLE